MLSPSVRPVTSSLFAAAQPPCSKPPRRSSSGWAGACMTPSSVRWLTTVTAPIRPLPLCGDRGRRTAERSPARPEAPHGRRPLVDVPSASGADGEDLAAMGRTAADLGDLGGEHDRCLLGGDGLDA